jgi:hypothetical protein
VISSRGIHKTSEQTLLKGRGVLVTEKNKGKYNWDEVPLGSKFVDETTGFEKVKIRDVLVENSTNKVIGYGVIKDGKVYAADRVTPILKADGTQYLSSDVKYAPSTDWVQTSRKYDGTLCVTKDIMIVRESFTVEQSNDGNNNMVYVNNRGERCTRPIQADGSYIFDLEYTYTLGRNHISVLIDGTKHYTINGDRMTEVSSKRFAVKEALYPGQVVTATYVHIVNIGNPVPRIFLSSTMPEEAESGDWWIDTSDFINTDLGVFFDKNILPDEPLDGGLQPKEANTPPKDIE